MLTFYKELLNHFELPIDDKDFLLEIGSRILISEKTKMTDVVDCYYDSEFKTELVTPKLEQIAIETGVSIYTVNFVFLATAAKKMKADYLKNGLSEKLFWDTINDLKYKLYECKKVKGVLGNFPIDWYPIFYKLTIFKLGRLEFEKVIYDKDTYIRKGITLRKGDEVLSVHIPSSGPLTKALCYESYKLAYNFFGNINNKKPLVCICDSWLLYEANRQIFKPESNLIKFMDDWDIIENCDDEKFEDAWRIFGVEYDGDPDSLPQTNSLQKAIVKWLKNGGSIGYGYGILAFDGEKVMT